MKPLVLVLAVAAAALALALVLNGTLPARAVDVLNLPADISTWSR